MITPTAWEEHMRQFDGDVVCTLPPPRVVLRISQVVGVRAVVGR